MDKISKNLVACNFSELESEKQESLLKGLEDGLKLKNITLYFEKEAGCAILNQENSMYEVYAELLPRLIKLSSKELEEFQQEYAQKINSQGKDISDAIKYLIEDAKLISECVEDYEIKQEANRILKLLGKQHFPYDYMEILNIIMDANNDRACNALNAFSYGIMIGKQQVRARRKRVAKVC